jgi:hypothetical protein
MPNWCSNNLTVKSLRNDKKGILELKSFYHENTGVVDGDRQDLSFNASVPIPKNADGEELYNGLTEIWGTKWDANEVYFENKGEELFYTFETAWSPPIEWLEKVSKMYPYLEFTLEFEESGVGLFGGVRSIDGNIEEWENDQPGNEEDEVTPEEAYEILQDGDTIMIKGWDMNEPRLYAGVTIEDFEGESEEEIIKTLSEYESIQYW